MSEQNHAQFAPPNHLVVLGHPDPDGFCGTVARTYCEEIRLFGHVATLRDLYALDFDPRLRDAERAEQRAAPVPPTGLAKDIDLVRHADVITLVYPIWFGMPPAIIKGYIDRVLGAGFDVGTIMRVDAHPALSGKRLMLFTSSASTRPWLEEKGQWIALRQAFDTYLRNVFDLRDAGHTHFDAIVPGVKQRFVDECLAVVRERARAVSAEILQEKRAAQSRAIRRGA